MLNVASTLQMLIQMYFLLMFYTNYLGISGTAAAIIVMIDRIWDFINDPIMGIVLEKSRRPKKSIFFMRCAIVPVAIFIVLCYTAPHLSYNLKVVWAAVTFICLGMSQTVYTISKDSLRPKLTSDNVERAKLNTYDSIFNTIVNAAVPAVTMPAVAWLSGFGEVTAFTKLAAIYAVIYIVTGFIGTYACKPYETDDEDEEELHSGSSMKAGEMIKALLTNKPALCVIIVQAVKMLLSSVGGSVMVYFCTYNLGDVNVMSVSSSIGTIAGLIPVLMLVWLYKRFGNAGTAMLGSVIAFGSFFILFITGCPTAMNYLIWNTVSGLGVVAVTAAIPQVIMDCIDYNEWRTGYRNTSVIMSAAGIGTKIGLAFGTSVAGLVIGAVEFDPNAAEQPQNVLDAFFHLSITVQMIVYVIIFLLMLYVYRIEKKLPEMKKEVEARKAAEKTAEANSGV